MEEKAPIQARYFTLAEAGEYCGGRSAEAMRMMARRGRIRVIKMGKRLMMDRMDIDQAMESFKLEIPAA
jgi:hypothetical protein